ncbi:MAG: 4Fe-4S dicluster domain-containing protein [Campylobacterales bacterium]|nr:4Fe-4S dicluster domain-containing protein [Campylobacterales bacterium]
MKKAYRLVHDENLCIGCQACSVACRAENKIPEEVYRLQVTVSMRAQDHTMDFTRRSCVMCDNAPCVEVCPTHATFQMRDGIVLVDEKRCVSCKYCALACPYGARYTDPLTKALQKCDFCYSSRILKGELPACVEVCPTDALAFGDINDPQSAPALKLKNNVSIYPKAHLGTKPKVVIIPNAKGMPRE